MKRIIAYMLTLVLVLAAFTIPASAAEKPYLPDPGPYMDAEGALYDTTSSNGVEINFYLYEPYKTLDEMNAFINAYATDVKGMDYSLVAADDECAYSVIYQHSSGPAAKLMIYFNDDADRCNAGEACSWLVLLGVPETIDFALTNGGNNDSNGNNDGNGNGNNDDDHNGNDHDHEDGGNPCLLCMATGKCLLCGGNGEVTLGNISAPCLGCFGKGVCNFCQGKGWF